MLTHCQVAHSGLSTGTAAAAATAAAPAQTDDSVELLLLA